MNVPMVRACGIVFASICIVLVTLADFVGIASDSRVAEHYAVDNEWIEQVDWRRSIALR